MADDGGLARFEQRMQAIPLAVREAVKKSLEMSAKEIVALAKNLCPVDEGALRDSIGWTWGEAPEGTMVLASTKGAALRITIFAGNHEAFYARWVEFGTTLAAAHPFFFPAYRSLKKRSSDRTKRAIRKAVKDNWGSK